MGQGLWYGMTREEAETRCRSLGLACSFTMTMDPKAVEDTTTVRKVIRAKEDNGVIVFLLGRFARDERGL